LTDGHGVDCVVEIGGPGTIAMSLQALAVGGHVSLIGASLTPSGLDPLIADRPRETGANNPARPTACFEPPAPTPLVGKGLESQTVGTEMHNSPYLYPDKPFVPLAVALRSMLAETDAKIPKAAPAKKARLQERAEVLREWLTPKSTVPLSS
jgi:hypothetical protein